MSYRIEIEAGALKTLSKLDKPVRRRLEAAIDRLADDPRPAGVVAMKSMPDHLRLRVGDYRIVYAVQDHISGGAGRRAGPPPRDLPLTRAAGSASPHLADLDERITDSRTRTTRRHQQDNDL